jgi:hypothetical protein
MGLLGSNADFLELWTGQSISEFGSQVSLLRQSPQNACRGG